VKHKKYFFTIFFALIFSLLFLSSSKAQDVNCSIQACIDFLGPTYSGTVNSITISGTITDLTPLSGITSVTGNLKIFQSSSLTNLNGLGNITSVGGNLEIYDLGTLTNLAGLESLQSVGGYIYIYSNAAQTTLEGLESLTSFNELIIQQNPALTSLAGLENLTSVSGSITILGNPIITNMDGLDNLTYLGGNLVISMNDALKNLEGLGSLASIGGTLTINNNHVLTDLLGLESLTTVTGQIDIQFNELLTNVDGLESLSSVGGNLNLWYSDALTNLDGLENLSSVGGDINISANPQLVSFCGLYPLLNTQETIYWNCNNNGANPTVADIIAGGPCPPLPVELISFTASTNNSIVELYWQTETEVNNYGFEILRCSQNTDWLKIGFLEGYGNSNSPKSYSFTDKYPTGGCNFKYKLKQIDNDGSYEYSTEIEVKLVTNNFNLYQNYPNPFNPETKISYTVPKTSDIVMKVFDILGIEIETLFSEQKQTGTYEITWNAEDLPSGVYFYRITAGNFVDTKKLMLLK